MTRTGFGWATAGLSAAWLAVAVTGWAGSRVVVPHGYFAVTYASKLPRITGLAFGPDSALYATQFDGQIYVMRDFDRNGTADTVMTYTTGLWGPLGLALRGGDVYAPSRGSVYRFRDLDGDHRADRTDLLISNLPNGRHWITGLAFGPDANLYVGLGSLTNLGRQTDPLPASILRFTPAGRLIDQFAKGFRNPYGIAFNARGDLFCTDNGPGVDSLKQCMNPPDELNWVQPRKHYGFPACFGSAGRCVDLGSRCRSTPCWGRECAFDGGCADSMVAPICELDPHSSSDGLCFGDRFAGFTADDVFIAQFGQGEFVPGCETSFGHKVVHVRLNWNGNGWIAGPVEDFATGFANPLAVAVGPDHALYVSDFGSGLITRIAAITSATGVGEPPRAANDSPAAFDLSPNPASAGTRLTLKDLSQEIVRCDVFDLAGRRVMERSAPTGGTVDWDLRDAAGRPVPSGVYLVRVRVGHESATRKLLVVE